MRVLVFMGILVSSVCMAGYSPDFKTKSVVATTNGHSFVEWVSSLFK